MDLGEIFGDSLVYPFNNIKSLVIFVILGIIAGIAVGGTIAGIGLSMQANNMFAAAGSGIIGVIVALFISFLIVGYELDIVKFGINRDAGSPSIDPVRQFVNGIKLLIVQIVYMIIPILIAVILGAIFQHWLSTIITFIIAIIFGLAALMGQCRLAKTESLGNALAVGEAIGDISKVGILKIILFIICLIIVALIISFISVAVTQLNATVGGIVLGILNVYFTFVVARATGLLYSDV